MNIKPFRLNIFGPTSTDIVTDGDNPPMQHGAVVDVESRGFQIVVRLPEGVFSAFSLICVAKRIEQVLGWYFAGRDPICPWCGAAGKELKIENVFKSDGMYVTVECTKCDAHGPTVRCDNPDYVWQYQSLAFERYTNLKGLEMLAEEATMRRM